MYLGQNVGQIFAYIRVYPVQKIFFFFSGGNCCFVSAAFVHLQIYEVSFLYFCWGFYLIYILTYECHLIAER